MIQSKFSDEQTRVTSEDAVRLSSSVQYGKLSQSIMTMFVDAEDN